MAAGAVTGYQRRKRERTASIPIDIALRGALAADRAWYEAGNSPPGWVLSHLLFPIPVTPAVVARRKATRDVVPRRASFHRGGTQDALRRAPRRLRSGRLPPRGLGNLE